MKTNFILASLLLAFMLPSCKDPVKQDGGETTPPSGNEKNYKIPVADVRTMVDKYRVERQEIINSNPDLQKLYGAGFEDTRCIWVSVDELRAFLKQVDTQVKEKDLKVKFDGLRMYLTVYPQKQDSTETDYLKSIKAEYRNHTSLLFVPTYYDSLNKISVDFDPSFAEDGKPRQLSSLRSKDSVSAYQSARMMNHGTLCPPMCPTDANGSSGAIYLKQ